MTTNVERVLGEIRHERARQMNDEGFDYGHDDAHDGEQLLHAAQSYYWAAIAPSQMPGGSMLAVHEGTGNTMAVPRIWPWESKWWKPSDGRRMLVKSGALCMAESERWNRIGCLSSAMKADQLLCKVIFHIIRGDCRG